MQIVLHKYTKTSMTSKASFLFLIVFIAAIISSFSYSYCRRKDLYIRRCVSNLRVLASKPVDITFEPSGKKIIAEQGELIEQVARKAGVTIPFKCKQGRCNSCEIRMNGKVSARVCQGATVPAGPTKKLSIVVVNKAPL